MVVSWQASRSEHLVTESEHAGWRCHLCPPAPVWLRAPGSGLGRAGRVCACAEGEAGRTPMPSALIGLVRWLPAGSYRPPGGVLCWHRHWPGDVEVNRMPRLRWLRQWRDWGLIASWAWW